MPRYTGPEIERMAEDISKVYPGEGWKRKVHDMGSAQIVAIHNNFKKRGYFNGNRPLTREERKKKKSKDIKGQINMFDYFRNIQGGTQ